MSEPAAGAPLTCPRCALPHPPSERFCRNCGMPLVYAGNREEEPITEAQERARKIRPQFARGDLIRVTGARNLADGEMIQGILLDQGIPSMLRRTRGFDVPDFLAAGPRDVLVPESGAELARELLRDAAVGETVEPGPAQVFQPWIVAAVLGGGLIAAVIAWLLANGS